MWTLGYCSCSPEKSPSRRTPMSSEQRVQETKTLDHFLQVIRNRLENSETLQKILAGSTSDLSYNEQDFKAEREALMSINNLGLREGLMAGLATFVTLRMAPRVVARMIARRQMNQNLSQPQRYVFDPPTSSKPNSASFSFMSLKFARFLLDSSASLLVAAYTSFYFTDEQVLLQTVRELPLVQGRSLVADEFCTALQAEFRKTHQPDLWRQVQSPYLQSLAVFVRNCELRQAHEATLRKEQGLQESEPVSIPPPGVFAVESVLDDSFGDPSLFGIDGDTLRDEDEDAWAKALVAAKGEIDESGGNQ